MNNIGSEGGEDEDLENLEDDELSDSLIQAFQYKVH